MNPGRLRRLRALDILQKQRKCENADPDEHWKSARSAENAGMTALKYSNRCKIGVNAFKKYDLCGKIIKLNTLNI